MQMKYWENKLYFGDSFPFKYGCTHPKIGFIMKQLSIIPVHDVHVMFTVMRCFQNPALKYISTFNVNIFV